MKWSFNSLKTARGLNIYRLLAAAGFLVALTLSIAVPANMFAPDDWAYYYAVENFSRGRLVIDNSLHSLQEKEALEKGGLLIQYNAIGKNKWALEKAPGYVFFLVPFKLMGIPRWGNAVLALGMTLVTYILLKRLRDEKAACIGSLLMLFTPVSLVMFNRTYMDTFASCAFLVMGGGLYLYHYLERERLPPARGAVLLFFSFLFLGWSVLVRYTNLPVAAVFALHFIITRLMAVVRKQNTGLRFEVPPVILGTALPLAIFLLYNITVFGSPFSSGYDYSPFPVKFAYNYIGSLDPGGHSRPLKIIEGNFRNVPLPLLTGFPLLIAGIPGIILVFYQKIRASFRRGHPAGPWANLDSGLPWDILLVFTGWFICVFGLYMMYEFTSTERMIGIPLIFMRDLPFIEFARFYLPGLLPLAIVVALILSRLPDILWGALLVIAAAAGISLYLSTALGETLIPRLMPPGFRPR